MLSDGWEQVLFLSLEDAPGMVMAPLAAYLVVPFPRDGFEDVGSNRDACCLGLCTTGSVPIASRSIALARNSRAMASDMAG